MSSGSAGGAWDAVDAASWNRDSDPDLPDDEPLGTKEKFWVTDPAGARWLFKYARERDGLVRGEDWTECLVHELAMLIGVPTAVVRLGVCNGRRGVLSRSVVSVGERLEHGNELLARIDPSYNQAARRENPSYTIAAIKTSLDGIASPREAGELADMSAFDAFCGYLMLDAWVAGRDRHHENWAAITTGAGRWLAPSFDHGNALGFQESDQRRSRLLAAPNGVQTWVKRGRSPHFAGRPSLVDLATDALMLAGPSTARYWMDKLAQVSDEVVDVTVEVVPDDLLSEVGRSFCRQLLNLNRERLLYAR